MTRLLPEERMSTHYEWVVEVVEVHNEDCEDIVDCSYWAEHELERALQDRATSALLAPPGHRVDFSLARSTGNECDGLQDRGYAYLEDGEWPETFDNGQTIPARFGPAFARINKELGR